MSSGFDDPDEKGLSSPTIEVESVVVEINAEAEKKLVRKLDWILLPLFTVIYGLNFIDRTAIGNAKIAGIDKDLDLTGYEYNIALTIFYISYILSEIPANLLLKHFGSTWLAILITSFGAVSIGSAFMRDFGGLVATRIILGIAEGGTLSGLTYVVSRYYRRGELVLRVGIFFGLSPTIAGAFGGLLASGLLSIPDIGAVASWRKIFLVEGIITTGFGLLCFIIIPDDPRYSKMLNEEERALALARIEADQPVSKGGKRGRTTVELVMRAFNFNTVVCALCYLMINISFQGLSLFMPTVVATLGHFTTVESQLRTVPPYLVAAIWVLFNTTHSYLTRQRFLPIILSVSLMVVGYAIFIGTSNAHARYGACFLAIAGGSPSVPMLLSWAVDNSAPDTVRAVTAAVVPGIGALGSIIAVWTYLPSDAPDYRHGNSLNLATSCATCVLTACLAGYIRWENGKRARGERDHRVVGKTGEEVERLGYLHPGFRYQM
ncbi:MFS general substrate transporter [Heliocybe sulcata]|uniref:MFS general substrate transporter n=1 Tax=Heliocybe sulcata TaxID=5364 RepID=A0A5C3N8V1_9AGAM|nr:MFS general substrate transporter [Heliocybe sulcata]